VFFLSKKKPPLVCLYQADFEEKKKKKLEHSLVHLIYIVAICKYIYFFKITLLLKKIYFLTPHQTLFISILVAFAFLTSQILLIITIIIAFIHSLPALSFSRKKNPVFYIEEMIEVLKRRERKFFFVGNGLKKNMQI
jgi:hypothetical protein